jgi:serine/threonine-protein kinase SRPK3
MNEGSSPFEYEFIDDVERLEKYRPGGYHPVSVGDTLHDRYLIVDKLGCGGYSTVWLARDTRQNRYVAVKIAVADSLPPRGASPPGTIQVWASTNRPTALDAISRASKDVAAHSMDEFFVHGPNGKHACFVTLPAQCDLREASFSRIFPIDVARALSASLVLSFAYVHSRGYAHGGKSRNEDL